MNTTPLMYECTSRENQMNQESRDAVTAKRGAFEAGFADGLDLSEFAAPITPRASHAASLLRIKQVEAVQKLEMEKEESNLQQLIQERAEALQQRSQAPEPLLQAARPGPTTSASLGFPHSKNTNPSASEWISNTVVAMHTAESKEEPKQKLRQGRRFNKASPMNRTKQGTPKVTKVAKRSMQTKY